MPSAAEYKLIVMAGDSDVPSFTEDIKFTQEVLRSWVAINTHRLANGPCRLVFSLDDANGGAVCKAEIRLQIANVGPLAESVKKSLDHFSTPIVVETCDVSHYDYSDESLTPWFDRKNALDHTQEPLTNRDISEMEASQLQQFVLDGYIVLPGLLSDEELERINQEIDNAVAKKTEATNTGAVSAFISFTCNIQESGNYGATRKFSNCLGSSLNALPVIDVFIWQSAIFASRYYLSDAISNELHVRRLVLIGGCPARFG